MAEAKRDENSAVTITAVSSVDLSTPVTVAVEPTTHAVIVKLG